MSGGLGYDTVAVSALNICILEAEVADVSTQSAEEAVASVEVADDMILSVKVNLRSNCQSAFTHIEQGSPVFHISHVKVIFQTHISSLFCLGKSANGLEVIQ